MIHVIKAREAIRAKIEQAKEEASKKDAALHLAARRDAAEIDVLVGHDVWSAGLDKPRRPWVRLFSGSVIRRQADITCEVLKGKGYRARVVESNVQVEVEDPLLSEGQDEPQERQ